jgi:hypothetical protein
VLIFVTYQQLLWQQSQHHRLLAKRYVQLPAMQCGLLPLLEHLHSSRERKEVKQNSKKESEKTSKDKATEFTFGSSRYL